MNSDCLNILIVCEHASDSFGGEAILPLNYFRFLSKTKHNVYLITHERVKPTLSKNTELVQENIFYIPDTSLHKFLHKIAVKLPSRISLVTVGFVMGLISQYYQRKISKNIITKKQIDIVHQPAPVSVTQPSAMFSLGVPVVIGPMNGGMTFPKAFDYMASKTEKLAYNLVSFSASVMNRIIPGKRNADLLLVANKRSQEAIPSSVKTPVKYLVENGTFDTKESPNINNAVKELTVLYVGRLVDWKCVDIAIEAVSKTKTNAKLVIVGDGEKRAELEHFVKSNNIADITFTGKVSHDEVNKYYDEADIFILPSVRECGGAVVLEAMSRGLPSIVTGWGGPKDYITEETGYMVEPKSRAYMIDEFAALIDKLSRNPDKRLELGQASISRVRDHFLWDKKVDAIIDIYQSLVSKSS
jgi:glycosyltransferase involved in cell wall biosynthesis